MWTHVTNKLLQLRIVWNLYERGKQISQIYMHELNCMTQTEDKLDLRITWDFMGDHVKLREPLSVLNSK